MVRLSANGVFAERDIVQFVPYRDSRSWMATICPEIAGKWSSSYDGSSRIAKVKLAKEVLAEIPDQLTSFMKSRNLVPMKRQTSSVTSPEVPTTSAGVTGEPSTCQPGTNPNPCSSTSGSNAKFGSSGAPGVAAVDDISLTPSAPPQPSIIGTAPGPGATGNSKVGSGKRKKSSQDATPPNAWNVSSKTKNNNNNTNESPDTRQH